MKLRCLLMALALPACSSPPEEPAPPPVIRTVDVSGTALSAAACIRKRAEAAGFHVQVHPLYGYEEMAVHLAPSAAGDEVGWLVVGRHQGRMRAYVQREAALPIETLLGFARGC